MEIVVIPITGIAVPLLTAGSAYYNKRDKFISIHKYLMMPYTNYPSINHKNVEYYAYLFEFFVFPAVDNIWDFSKQISNAFKTAIANYLMHFDRKTVK